jgi:hypothetical protein
MLSLTAAALIATSLTSYPVYGDKPPIVPRGAQYPRIEAAIDKGPVLELIVRCGGGAAIVHFSKIERVYCAPSGRCRPGLAAALGGLCR